MTTVRAAVIQAHANMPKQDAIDKHVELFTQERGDEAAGKLAAKFARIAREAVEGRGGTLLELRGDEALCVFGSTRQAIRAAVDMQERFVEETLADPELPLTGGIGLAAPDTLDVAPIQLPIGRIRRRDVLGGLIGEYHGVPA